MPLQHINSDQSTERAWTVYGSYRDEGFADGGISEGDFAGLFYAPTAKDAECLALEDEPWLEAHSVIVEPCAAGGVPIRIPDSQLHLLTNAPELTL